MRVVIFDLWNTLIEVNPKFNPYPRVERLLGKSEAEFRNAMRLRWMTRPDLEPDDFLDYLPGLLNVEITGEIRGKFNRIWSEYLEAVNPVDGAFEVLAGLRKRDFKIAVVTNTVSTSKSVYESTGLSENIDEFVVSCDHGLLKPDPRIFDVAIERLGVTPEDCYVVGDKLRTDILGGLILGCRCVLFDQKQTRPIFETHSSVHAIICELTQLLEVVDGA